MALVSQGLAQIPKRPHPSSLLFRTPGPRNFQQTTPSWSHPETLHSTHPPSTQPECGWGAQTEAGFSCVLPNFNAVSLLLETPSLLVFALRLNRRKHSPGWSLFQSSLQGHVTQDEP